MKIGDRVEIQLTRALIPTGETVFGKVEELKHIGGRLHRVRVSAIVKGKPRNEWVIPKFVKVVPKLSEAD